MSTYGRIISFAKPYHRYFPQYIVFAFLAIIFGLMNLALLEPLFSVIFETKTTEQLTEIANAPRTGLNIDSIKSVFFEKLLDVKAQYGKQSMLIYVSLVIGASALLSNLFTYLSNVTMGYLKADVIQKIRAKVFLNTTGLHLGFFSGERKGDIMSRMTNDVQEIENTLVSSLKVFFREPATIIVYLAYLFSTSVKLTLFTLVFFPIMGFVISEIVKRLKKKAIMSQESLGRIVNLMDEVFGGMRVIKAFNAKGYINELFDKETQTYKRINKSMARKNELASPVSQFLGIIVVATLLVYGGNLVLSEDTNLDPEGLMAYIIVFSQILNPAKSISQSISSIQRGMASATRIFKLIDEQPKINNIEQATQKHDFENALVFENVGFRYEKEYVLQGINLTVEKGKTIALVGSSGAGKSTLADLVPRFYDPTEGSIQIDGVDIRNIDINSLRGLMGIVTQESILFNDTVAKNIAFAMPNASQAEIEQAAKIANAHDFIMELEKGYETNIGDRGGKLSGGQRQRLSIARAVMKNPPILILDEATSALDTESEKLVQQALTNLMKSRTSIVIAHRLSTIQHADTILVMDKGRVVESGNHDTLMAQQGMYHRLITMQSI
ncbi:ATP-binding cassette, subfamily B, MsbA [Roseivirga pacifica]|uniref:ATP-binding cassette, subfamily B, MsbA n=1 Tax=Roseivirga pacifica TaxID=1267423 RepID=A0A1I0NDF4_9BACT|nr:ABC transporter ATP-binding protein [Roseivirga pacifica]MCO6359626.1 ATP-binding cassette domain-containing protein [Roseivirga pacifica]MCO6366996.1 ATP-binding cassette domain-containing protein [Roseivirga pacifica]MCO6370472.1 ATP-binding cassette domain-containing protein [Roseivirga pacifica]MCO6374653.1 ATP-binding cassette domain-containing protein [Roseivirga pacifica]MCO6379911.1 ATP-binding cassette domain-containing protein [Roseivirga pacifica]